MDDLEILKVVQEVKRELNLSNDDIKQIAELANVMFGSNIKEKVSE
jgi:hypothetical protein